LRVRVLSQQFSRYESAIFRNWKTRTREWQHNKFEIA
jgi:hypothetical protein